MKNIRPCPRDMSLVGKFVDKRGRVVDTGEDYQAKKVNVGKAFAFFNSRGPPERIRSFIPAIRPIIGTPKGLQLLLHEGASGLQLDEELAEAIHYPYLDDYRTMPADKRFGQERRPLACMKYAAVAEQEGASNEDTAGKLGDLLNGIYLEFDEGQEPYRGVVVYKDNDGKYTFR